MTNMKVAIIGGGLAGLNAARLLHHANIDFRLLEARDYLGGRIRTVSAAGDPGDDGFDLGPSWFWPRMQPAIATLVAETGLPIFPQHSEGDVLFERMSREPAHRLSGTMQDAQSMRIAGGSAALVRAIAASLPAERLQTRTEVTALRLASEGITLTVRQGGEEETLHAAQVIAALPPRVLERTIVFQPDLPSDIRALWQNTPTWMAPHAKFFALYDRPFWREAGFSGTAQSMVGPMPEIHDATTASGQAALFGFLGIGAVQRQRLGEVAIAKACIAQFARLFGPEAANPHAALFKDWAADNLTATEADPDTAGHPAPADIWIEGPWADRLVLAGSETSPIEAGYLSGAVEASAAAAREITRRLGTANGGHP